MLHAFTVDVEDWYHDGPLPLEARGIDRVERNTMHMLEIMQERGAKGTFFCLGEVAERYPQLIRTIAAGGHEIASHGYKHERVMDLTRREFRVDVERSLRLLEDTVGQPIRGYRAPYFSIKVDIRWPVDILADLGLTYDSSVLAIDRPPGLDLVCPRAPFQHHNGLWEVPVALLPVFQTWHLPLAGGSGLRLLPEGLFYRFVRAFEKDIGAGVFYVHPWELDVDSPTAAGISRWILRYGRARLAARLSELLARRQFASIGEVFAGVLS